MQIRRPNGYNNNETFMDNSGIEIGNKTFVRLPLDYTGIYQVPTGIQVIAQGAFTDCKCLTSVILPNTVIKIEKNAFAGCVNMLSIKLSANLEIIESKAFWNCHSLNFIDLPQTITSIGDRAFQNCTRLFSIELPNRIEIINFGLCAGCINLVNVDIPNSVTKIDVNAFMKCESLERIDIPNSVKEIGGGAFCWCNKLHSVELPSELYEISNDAFMFCKNLTSINIPDTVHIIGSGAFSCCSHFKLNKLPLNICKIDSGAFSGCILPETLYIGDIADDISGLLDSMSNHKTSFSSSGNNQYYQCIDGSICSKDMTILYYAFGSGESDFIVPDSVSIVESYAFYNSDFRSVTMGDNVKKICEYAFNLSRIDKVYISSGIIEIANDAFAEGLPNKELHIRHEHPENIIIDNDAFIQVESECVVFVPIGTKYAYKHITAFIRGGFKEFKIEK